MKTEPVFIEIDLNNVASGNLNRTIESQLARWGEPLRWSITEIDPQTKIASIEAIVINVEEDR